MVLPLRSINTKKTGKAPSDPLDGLASRLHGVLAEDRGQRLAKARVAVWIRALFETLFPQTAEWTYATAGEVRDALDASAAELRALLRPLEDDIGGALALGMSAFLVDRSGVYPDYPGRLGGLAELPGALGL